MKSIFTICLMLIGAMTLQAQDLKPFKADNGKFGYKDENGKVIVAPKYDFAYDFSEGLARVHILGEAVGRGYGKAIRSGYINTKGEEVIPLMYTNVYDFQDGLAWVNTGGEFIDTGFSQQFAGGKWGVIDKNGKVVIPLEYDKISPIYEYEGAKMIQKYFKDGKAKVTKDGREFYIDKTGKEVQ